MLLISDIRYWTSIYSRYCIIIFQTNIQKASNKCHTRFQPVSNKCLQSVQQVLCTTHHTIRNHTFLQTQMQAQVRGGRDGGGGGSGGSSGGVCREVRCGGSVFHVCGVCFQIVRPLEVKRVRFIVWKQNGNLSSSTKKHHQILHPLKGSDHTCLLPEGKNG